MKIPTQKGEYLVECTELSLKWIEGIACMERSFKLCSFAFLGSTCRLFTVLSNQTNNTL